MVREDAGDSLIELGEPDRLPVGEVFDGEIEAAVPGEQRPDPRMMRNRLRHEHSDRSVIPGRRLTMRLRPSWSPARCSSHDRPLPVARSDVPRSTPASEPPRLLQIEVEGRE